MKKIEQKLFNHPSQKAIRQKLRQDAPTPEKILWRHLRNRQLGVKFRRQHGIGKYIVDFYCPDRKLVIEVDGDSHYWEGKQDLDSNRDAYMQSLGVKVLRFTNIEVMSNLYGVLEAISEILELRDG